MLRINALGALELLDTAGKPLHRLMQHDKRIALLFYLLIARPRRAHRRDSLLPIFWPELDVQHARNSLRQALHLLRSTLADDVLHSTATTVGVHWSRIACDALDFELLLENGKVKEAMQLYRGDLLPGFYIANAPQFEEWLEIERARLRQVALIAMLQLATESPDDHAAIHWLRRAEAIAPFQEDIVRDLMHRHVRAENPGLALAAYDHLVNRLRKEMDIAVSTSTTRIADEIRTGHSLRPPVIAGG